MSKMSEEGRLKDKLECPKKKTIQQLLQSSSETSKSLIFMRAGEKCLSRFIGGSEQEFVDYFTEHYKEVRFPYDWAYNEAVKEDSFKWHRVARYIMRDAEFVTGYQTIYTLHGTIQIPVVTKDKNGCYHAYVLVNKVNPLSNKARKPENMPRNSLVLACIKQCMEKKYPGITVHQLGITSKNDTTAAKVDELSPSDDAFSDFREYYGEDRIGTLEEHIEEILELFVGNFTCTGCKYQNVYCNVAKFVPEKDSAGEKKDAQFTNDQQEAINCKQGPVIVCACPGSGKTTVLIERVKKLIADGVPPESILLITFSKSATGEIMGRLPVEGEDTTVSTIHSLCLEILRMQNESIVVEDRAMRYNILNSLVNGKKIQGAGYGSLYDENTGFITRLDDAICSMRDGKAVRLGSFDENEIREILDAYEEVRKARNCITYDEMQSMALELLKSKPAILRIIQTRFRYIMVDEFQDVDHVENELITLIASKSRNIMVVGDDDQAIYGFRGGSNRYMLEFKKTYPDAKQITLGDNFRSTEQIVHFADNFIQKNVERIAKRLVAHKTGVEVETYDGIHIEDIKVLVNNFLMLGYSLGDIAIISFKNSELAKISALLGGEISRLNRTKLYNDPVFNTVNAVLRLKYEDEQPEAFLRLVALHTNVPIEEIEGVGMQAFTTPGVPYADEFRALWKKVDSIVTVKKEHEISDVFSQITKTFFGVSYHAVTDDLLDMLNEMNVNTLAGASRVIQNLLTIKDDRRVVYPSDNRVTLLTAHDSKGLEFPCVILTGLEDFKSGNTVEEREETRRLLYVAMTRAKEHLIVCQSAGSELSEFWNDMKGSVVNG